MAKVAGILDRIAGPESIHPFSMKPFGALGRMGIMAVPAGHLSHSVNPIKVIVLRMFCGAIVLNRIGRTDGLGEIMSAPIPARLAMAVKADDLAGGGTASTTRKVARLGCVLKPWRSKKLGIGYGMGIMTRGALDLVNRGKV